MKKLVNLIMCIAFIMIATPCFAYEHFIAFEDKDNSDYLIDCYRFETYESYCNERSKAVSEWFGSEQLASLYMQAIIEISPWVLSPKSKISDSVIKRLEKNNVIMGLFSLDNGYLEIYEICDWDEAHVISRYQVAATFSEISVVVAANPEINIKIDSTGNLEEKQDTTNEATFNYDSASSVSEYVAPQELITERPKPRYKGVIVTH